MAGTRAQSRTKRGERQESGAASVEREIGRETLTIETGVLAKQAHGAVVVRYGDGVVLVTATTSKPFREVDFFPLTVDYRERTPAAGKFPGGFIKREGRPTDKEILTCRCIDRPIRPLFEKGFKDEVQVLCNVLSADPNYDSDVLAMIGAYAALAISKLPFHFLGGSVRVGMKDDELILMPNYEERDGGELDLVVSGTPDAVTMVEAGASELPEETMLEAIEYGHEAIQEICSMVDDLRERVGVEKISVPVVAKDDELFDRLRDEMWDDLRETLLTPGKHMQKAALRRLADAKVEEMLGPDDGDSSRSGKAREIKNAIREITGERTRRMVLDEDLRIDGRGLTDIRPISVDLGILPRVHGSAVFTRGETQALGQVTLGTQSDQQRVDGLRDPVAKPFYLHYYFPPFSVGECKPIRGPGRREIGHGMLAERALVPVLPDDETFPYTIRIISDILESNGSSSMATVCAGSLAMMDAGVPLREPVAGIAMGLISEGDDVKVLSDILGEEDHTGDMDFKVTGTQGGVTALQMDIKITGLTLDVLRDALEQARVGRLHILQVMNEKLEAARENLHPHAPRVVRRTIPVEKIALLIGPGGRNIRAIQERTETNLEVNDAGGVVISGTGTSRLEEAARYVESFSKDVELGQEFDATVVDIRDFGAFVELSPGKEALCHVSELSEGFVDNVRDVVKQGDTLHVRVIAIDPSGKVKVSAKAATESAEANSGEEAGRRRPPRGRGREEGGRGRGGREESRGPRRGGRDEERPARRSSRDDEERPPRRGRDEEERPARRSSRDDDERPARRSSRDEDDRPPRRSPRDDDDQSRSARRGRRPRRDEPRRDREDEPVVEDDRPSRSSERRPSSRDRDDESRPPRRRRARPERDDDSRADPPSEGARGTSRGQDDDDWDREPRDGGGAGRYDADAREGDRDDRGSDDSQDRPPRRSSGRGRTSSRDSGRDSEDRGGARRGRRPR